MNIIILGAGQFGTSIAELLTQDNNNVTVIDLNNTNLQKLQDRLDIRVVLGHGTDPDILVQAGLEETDMLIAATQNDDTNILACQLAHIMHKTPTKVARVRSKSYLNHPELFNSEVNSEAISIDLMISPEILIKDYIMQLIAYPGSLQVVDFAEGRVRLVAIRAYAGGLIVGKKIADIKHYLPANVQTRIVAIYRRNEMVIPNGEAMIRAGDEVFFLAEQEHIQTILHELRRKKLKPSRNIMIAGGGNIGFNLAKELEKQNKVKVIDRNIEQARHIAESLDNTIVIQGDVSDKELLIEESIDDIDLFLAVTNSDEANIISGMLAKKLGVKRVIALVNNQSYVELIQLNSIDVAISADQITISDLLHYVHEGDTVKAFTLRRGTAEAMEIVVHGSENSSQIIGRKIGHIEWPDSITIGCIIREEELLFSHSDLTIEAEDHVILFIHDRKHIIEIEKLFNPEEKKSWF